MNMRWHWRTDSIPLVTVIIKYFAAAADQRNDAVVYSKISRIDAIIIAGPWMLNLLLDHF